MVREEPYLLSYYLIGRDGSEGKVPLAALKWRRARRNHNEVRSLIDYFVAGRPAAKPGIDEIMPLLFWLASPPWSFGA